MDFLSKLGTILIVFTYITLNINGEDVCVKKGPCLCVFPNGTGIDLRPTNKSTFFTTTNFDMKKGGQQIELSTYYYHPCSDMVPPVKKNTANDTCDTPLVYEKDGLGISSYLGKTNESIFSNNGNAITYMNVPSPEEGRSFGSTLLIIFFSLVIFYLVLGICTKKFLMGATGVEVIPNLGFWTDLPNLVKLPARGPGPVTSPDPNSYDSI
ncbi:putative mannose-6-phosphate receptor domain-containing protein [Operophtera brumata]|uniref:Putative mannose-6-phosphate receptor domain-containing protein n=1 Tax=Operophtera brumata TaxID=104452 RepID=A0A0L7L493_OPEBR|nr:putative mannose-6-phosphate receptor domain-containing protein [Operophtera brumata]